ncbi:hypothetical protein HanPSC8_Chr09g0390941 [Helianthus annuus]|nr:hypothetical protein HanIR_Chr09g0436501 [Helianthus annuus]KAJ0894608.1 hypothetical protein HanPSC8_Chr09g0390941 [Helianthus annuus]
MLMLGIHKETTIDSCMPQLSFVCLVEMYNEDILSFLLTKQG